MTQASEMAIVAALTAYKRLDDNERAVFKLMLKLNNPEPAAKRGRPPKKENGNATQPPAASE